MALKEIDEDNYNRLANLIIENNSALQKLDFDDAYLQAVNILQNMQLRLYVSDNIRYSESLQSAVITAINCGKRAFLGGIEVFLENDFKSRLRCYEHQAFSELIILFGGKIVNNKIDDSFILKFGSRSENENEVEVLSNGWQGGIVPFGYEVAINDNPDFGLGGITAGSLAVGLSFLEHLGLCKTAFDKPRGISLWRPDLKWIDTDSQGPSLEFLPKKLWLIGLGHLGQAYIWTLSFLPFLKKSDVEILLQDFDSIVESNFTSGMLSSYCDIGKQKTRVTSKWLEEKGFKTKIIERAFGDSTKPLSDDPAILLGGVDSLEIRRSINPNLFGQFLDCGLGGSLGTFDSFSINNFPMQPKRPSEIWKAGSTLKHKAVELMEKKKVGCGVLAEKAISSAFVGVFSSTLVISELLRSYNEGMSYSELAISLRNIDDTIAVKSGKYNASIAKYGFTLAC